MSIHAHPSEEVKAWLNARNRSSTISSVVISLLVIVMVFLALGYFLLPNLLTMSPTVVIYKDPNLTIVEPPKATVKNSLRQKPSAPAERMTGVIAPDTTSTISIPVPDVDVATPSADFGDGENFGDGWIKAGETGSGTGFEAIHVTMRKRCSKEDRIARLQEMGGNPLAEDVVEKGLEWLGNTQNADGSWNGNNQSAITGFTVLAYLGRCETPISEKYGDSCLRGISYLVNLGMKTGGKLSNNLADKHWPYEHAIATYAICEAASFCKQLGINIPNLEEVARKSTEFIITNQHAKSGGWDYAYDITGTRGGDTSIAAWHVQALKAASHTGIEFRGLKSAQRAAANYLEKMQNKSHGGFGYGSANAPAGGGDYFTMTGGCTLSLQMLGKENSAAVRKGASYILKNSQFDYNGEKSDLYAHYYESQAMMVRGGAEWQAYNEMFKDQLVSNQNPNGSWKASGGRGFEEHYRNCLNILMLEVYYRFLPATAAK